MSISPTGSATTTPHAQLLQNLRDAQQQRQAAAAASKPNPKPATPDVPFDGKQDGDGDDGIGKTVNQTA